MSSKVKKPEKSGFQKTVLPNGARVLTESHPQSRSVVIGFWVLTGTRDEKSHEAGVSHFLEHLVFKETKNKTGYQIARSLEAVGGDLNAYTTKEYTCYHATCLKEHVDIAIDVLSELVTKATLPEKEFGKERDVVLQEIAMSNEDYSEWIYDGYLKDSFGTHPTGVPILGYEKTLSKMNRKEVNSYYRKRYYGENLLITATGAISHQELIDKTAPKLKGFAKKGESRVRRKPKIRPMHSYFAKQSEQAHVLVGWPTASYKDEYRLESYLTSVLLGGGMTSKLYQSVREKRGLAYSVYAYLYTFVDFAMAFVYAGTDPKKATQAVGLIQKELEKLHAKGVSQRDLKFFQTQSKGALLLGADDLESRMTSLGINEMIFKKYRTIETLVAEIENVSVESINAYIKEYIRPENLGLAVLAGESESQLQSWVENHKF